jgi:hypothetical protein
VRDENSFGRCVRCGLYKTLGVLGKCKMCWKVSDEKRGMKQCSDPRCFRWNQVQAFRCKCGNDEFLGFGVCRGMAIVSRSILRIKRMDSEPRRIDGEYFMCQAKGNTCGNEATVFDIKVNEYRCRVHRAK